MSRQDWRTPPEILELAVKLRGAPLDLDVACSPGNQVCVPWISEDDYSLFYSPPGGPYDPGDALKLPWFADHAWCNPPFKKIMPWVQRAIHEVTTLHARMVTMLLPASVGSKWFALAHQRGEILLCSPRVQYWHQDEQGGNVRGESALVLFGTGAVPGKIDLLKWKEIS